MHTKKITTLFLITVVVACTHKMAPTSTGKPALDPLVPAQVDADRAAAKWPGTTLADLSKGKALYEANCAKCHDLKKPASQSEEGWNKIIPPMARKAQIDAKTQDIIQKYLITLATRS